MFPVQQLWFKAASRLYGQVHDIVAMASRTQTEFREQLDRVLLLLKNKGVPPETRSRVKLWLTHTHNEDNGPGRQGLRKRRR